ncbi:hypothetical protein [Synechococcus sp. BA-132 BA5]|uniref:hypothetical protein n=1 Tax=Synechococcus sp. BA-132 BA5 TaxID=3110252 RepID=UPI002B1F2EA0|nr:hypothetical protein [Synechococcus sp. BA-132 BA5]MEA5413637.1 hypothetical protein [Synechococcus sp. BA-132 BA5]
MVRIRTFLGVQPRSVSVGGSRSGAAQSVCLVAPGPIEPSANGSVVLVLDRQPTLVLGTQLNEIEIRRGETVLWSKLASSKAPISGSIPWPLAPLQAGEQLELAMRPKGAAGGDWGVVILEAATAGARKSYLELVKASTGNVELRLQQLDQATGTGDRSLAHALLWAPITPNNSALAALQKSQQSSCRNTPSTW